MERCCDVGVDGGGGVTTSSRTSEDFVSMVSTISATLLTTTAVDAAAAAATLLLGLIITAFVLAFVVDVVATDAAAAGDTDADDMVTPLLRKTRIDCVLSSRFSVCKRIGPSTVVVCPFLAICCCRIMEPSGRQAELFFSTAFCIITCCCCCCIDWCICCIGCCWSIIVPLPDDDDDDDVDCIRIVDSFDDDVADNVGIVVDVVDNNCVGLRRACCSTIDLSSSLSRLNSSWLFCNTICPFSLREPRTTMIL